MTPASPINSAGKTPVAAPQGAADPGMPNMASICGAFPIRITRDGTWFYHGSPIGRKPLVRLFARVLHRRADGGFWLTTPYESGSIEVDDAPFVAVLCDVAGAGRGQELAFTTNLDETVRADADHPIVVRGTLEAPQPYVTIRPGLEARICRAVFYQLVDLAAEEQHGGQARLGVWSAGNFFPLEPIG